jgi:hypothetical protein
LHRAIHFTAGAVRSASLIDGSLVIEKHRHNHWRFYIHLYVARQTYHRLPQASHFKRDSCAKHLRILLLFSQVFDTEIDEMTDQQRPVVGKIIETFKSQLESSAREQITSAQFADLAIMIDEAIKSELGTAAELVEAVAKQLRASARGPEIGL